MVNHSLTHSINHSIRAFPPRTHQQLQRNARALALPARDAPEVDIPDALVGAARQGELLHHPVVSCVCKIDQAFG